MIEIVAACATSVAAAEKNNLVGLAPPTGLRPASAASPTSAVHHRSFGAIIPAPKGGPYWTPMSPQKGSLLHAD